MIEVPKVDGPVSRRAPAGAHQGLCWKLLWFAGVDGFFRSVAGEKGKIGGQVALGDSCSALSWSIGSHVA